MADPSLELMTRTLAKLVVAEMVLIPVTVASFLIRAKRPGCLLKLIRLGLVAATVVVALPLFGAFIMVRGL